MKDFFLKHKDELTKPFVFILVGLLVIIMGAINGSLEDPITILLGGGCIVLGAKDIVAMYIDNK